MSSTYAAILCGLLGLNVERTGVNLKVAGPNGGTDFEVVVAQACSGLTSMMVLLALGYLITYFTPIKLGWRALLMAVVVPLTLLCNSVRLSVILLIGSEFNKKLAMWAHDNEGPVLIFFCSILLMGIRAALMKWLEPRDNDEETARVREEEKLATAEI
jgi:exosortase/archaeosortase family protein